MGARGPRPADGSNISPIGVVPVKRPDPPQHLHGGAAEVWREVVAGMPGDALNGSGLVVLEAYCTAAAALREATAALYADGKPALTIRAPSGRVVPNPLLGIINAQSRNVASLSTKLRIARGGRSRDRAPGRPATPGRAGLLFQDAPEAD
jgi:phage terminase small subunit